MSEHAEGSIVIEAFTADVMDVITDYEAYPEWADVKSAKVLQRGEGGLATEVAFEVDVPVLGKATYTLAYRYAPGDAGVSWVTKEARGTVRDIAGEYLLNELSGSSSAEASNTCAFSRLDKLALTCESYCSQGKAASARPPWPQPPQ
jgi:hypothetical protein